MSGSSDSILSGDAAAALGLYGRAYRIVDKFGGADGINTSEIGRVVYAGMGTADYIFQTSAAPLRVRAGGNAADDAGGSGARTIQLSGLNENYDEVVETIITDGTSAGPASVNNFIRISRAKVVEVGATGFNVGDIVIETADTGDLQAVISAEEGQTRLAFYTIPRGYVGELVSVTGIVSRSGGASTNASFALYSRTPGFSRNYRGDVASGIGQGTTITYAGITIPEMTDLFVVLKNLSANGTDVSVQMLIRVFKKDSIPGLFG